MFHINDISQNVDYSDINHFNASVRVLADQMAGRLPDIEMVKILSDNHTAGCHCTVCDYVDDFDHEESIVNPVSEPEYVY